MGKIDLKLHGMDPARGMETELSALRRRVQEQQAEIHGLHLALQSLEELCEVADEEARDIPPYEVRRVIRALTTDGSRD